MINYQELTFLDRSKWSHGEWDNEPDKIYWKDEETGYDCLIKRVGHSGHLCGYVGVPESHILYGKHYDDEKFYEIDVHGGLTYSDYCQEDDKKFGICHISGGEDKVYWFGFDCAHSGDYMPIYAHFDMNYLSDVYRNVEYVKNQVKKLAIQLKKYEV